MRDLVETVIGQVLQREPIMKPFTDKAQPSAQKPTFHAIHIDKPIEIKDLEMWDACCQFEAIFLQQMMQAMRKTVPESSMMPRSYANDMYNSMMDQAIAETGSHQAPLGLAMNMYKQLQRDGFTQDSQTQAQAIVHTADTLKGNIAKPDLGGPHG
jgi:hypothetical protein